VIRIPLIATSEKEAMWGGSGKPPIPLLPELR